MGSRFRRTYIPTVGADFSFKEQEIEGKSYQLLTWDLAGEPKFRHVRSLYFQGAFGAMVVFDLTNEESFHSLDEWISDIVSFTPTNGIPFWILGNKNDLILTEEEQCVSDNEIENYISTLNQKFGDKFEIGFSKTSAVTGENVDAAFEGLVKNIMNWVPKRKELL